MSRNHLLSFFLLASLGLGSAEAAQVPRPSPEFAISLPAGGQLLLSQYRGKVVALMFLFTTCPHCQHSAQILSGLQNEYGSQGFQVLGSAFNDSAAMLVPNFTKQFATGFPVGFSTREAVQDYLQHPSVMRLSVPILVLIDRKGVIRGQHTGEDNLFNDQEKNMRAAIEALLKEPAAGNSKKTIAKAKK